MKVAMVTPMASQSAIADVMMQAVPHLATTWDLEVWCPTEPSYRTCTVPMTPYAQADAEVLESLREYDLVVYVLGDSPWHSRILPLAQRLPGLVVLHDASMTNLVRHTALENGELDDVLARITDDYGSEMVETFTTGVPPGRPEAWLRFCADVPLDALVVERSLGAVVHSRWHGERVAGKTLGEVAVAPLPVPSTRPVGEEDDNSAIGALLDELSSDDLLLVTVGMVNANRRIDLVLRAMASDPHLAQRLHLWAVGPNEGPVTPALLQLAKSLGLQSHFAAPGRVSDSQLQLILARADIGAALRDPVLEGQSASLLTQLLSGTPALVYDHAHYSELPDEVAMKVRSDAGPAEVAAALRTLTDDSRGRTLRGELGRDYVLSTRSGLAYAEAIRAAGERALATKALALLTADLSSRLARLDLRQDDAVVDTVTALAFELFDLA